MSHQIVFFPGRQEILFHLNSHPSTKTTGGKIKGVIANAFAHSHKTCCSKHIGKHINKTVASADELWKDPQGEMEAVFAKEHFTPALAALAATMRQKKRGSSI